MKELQFTAVVMLSLMTLALILLLPGKVSRDRVANLSRWLMASGLAILDIQFLIQYIFGFREIGVTQAVFVNLLFIIPCATLMSLSILNLQRQGKLTFWMKWTGPVTYLTVVTILTVAEVTDKKSFGSGSSHLLVAEIIAGALYGIMQLYYSYLHLKELSRMEYILNNYFDHSKSRILYWIKGSSITLSLLAMGAPILIFSQNWLLRIYCTFLFMAIFAMWFCFVRYVISSELNHVNEAEQSKEEEEAEEKKDKQDGLRTSTSGKAGLPPTAKMRAEKAAGQWADGEGYLRQGITSPVAAQEMNLPRYLLTAWVKESGYNSFSNWVTTLRIERAKKLMLENPDWSNETIADLCGISRSHFQRVFKEETGQSPADFVNSKTKAR